MQTAPDLPALARGHWSEILPALGIGAEYLSNRHGPCPGCGGKDRFRFDDKDGRGTFVCGGGGDPLTGDGFDLLQHVFGWGKGEAFRAVGEVLGIQPARQHGTPARKPVATPKPVPPPAPAPQRDTGVYAKAIWTRANRDKGAVAGHPYAIKKGINWSAGAGRGQASGRVIGRDVDCLLIPIRDIRSDQVEAVQAINSDGAKQSFGAIKGRAFVCGNTLDKGIPWFVVEGWADAVSLVFHAHQGNAAGFACMGHHFDLVAQTVVEHYAPQRLVVLGDAP